MGWIRFDAPALSRPERLQLQAQLMQAGAVVCENDWPLFVYPVEPEPTAHAEELCLFDPDGIWADAKTLAGYRLRRVQHLAEVPAQGPVLASHWTPEWHTWVRQGGRLLLAAGRGSGVAVKPMPFWRGR
jgi:hypothetical protein